MSNTTESLAAPARAGGGSGRSTGGSPNSSSSMNLKAVLIGAPGAGKTTLSHRFQYGTYKDGIRTTVGCEYKQKAMVVDGNNVTVRLFDIAGQDSTMCGSRAFYQGALGVFVVIDASNPQSIEGSLRWKKDVDEKTNTARFCQQTQTVDGAPFVGDFKKVLPCILLLNKCDLGVQCGLSKTQLANLCQRHGFAGYMETSAVTGENTEKALEMLVRLMQEAADKADKAPATPRQQGVQLKKNLKETNKEGPCANC